MEITKEEFEALQATNERILAEHKADKLKFSKRIGEFEQKANDDLEKQNDHKTLHEQAMAKLKTVETELTNTKYNAFEKNLTIEVTKLAKDAHNPTAIMRALNISGENTDLDNGTLVDLSTQIDGLRKDEPYLFNHGQPNQTTSVPRFMKNDTTEKAIGDMSVNELEQSLKEKARRK